MFLAAFGGVSFAAPGVKIIEPQNGAVLHSGQECTIRVEAVEGFTIKRGIMGMFKADGVYEFNTLPLVLTPKVPIQAIGTMTISVGTEDVSGNWAEDEITVIVEPLASLVGFDFGDFNTAYFETDWNGVPKPDQEKSIVVDGIYDDGITRDIAVEELAFTSSDPSIVSVDFQGRLIPHRLGKAYITVSKGEVSGRFNVEVNYPRGIRPSETIPPTTQINIQPPANPAGWHNTDITLTITAQDNEGGSGFKELRYIWFDSPEYEFVPYNEVVLTVSKEGENGLVYYAVDNELNKESSHRIEFKLDKTPPQTTAVISPPPDASGWIRSLPVKVTFTAIDILSGVAYTTPEKLFTEPGTYQVEYYSKDIAGNMEVPKTLTVNIAIEDTTPPEISLELVPIRLNLSIIEKIKCRFANFYKLVYSATDEQSGVKEIKVGLIMPDISNFKTKLIKGRQLEVTLNEKLNLLIIHAPDPENILTQIKEGLFLIQNNQPLHLQLRPRSPAWTIVQTHKFLLISAPGITFKAIATDNAGNTATEELKYEKEEHR